MLTYFIHIATALLAMLYLAKDWESHKNSWRRLSVLCLITVIGIVGIINTFYTNKKIDRQHQHEQSRIAALKEAVDTANKNQENNTAQFVSAFGKMIQKVSDLQSQVRTAGLREEADRLKTELQATQKAMITPKAALVFSFERPRTKDPLLRVVTLPVKDGIIHVEFTVRNETDTPALNGELTLEICGDCSFATEPPLFKKLPGQPETQRNYKFDRILAKTELRTLSADIRVPTNVGSVELGLGYRCVNCIVSDSRTNVGIIRLSR